jgi:hypothetical protein
VTGSSPRHLRSVDEILLERFAAAVSRPTEPRWDDVRRRARMLSPEARRPRGRRYVLAIAAVVAAVGAGAPALGLDRAVVDFFRAERAPEEVQVTFADINDVGHGTAPGAISTEARLVHIFRTASGEHPLSVTPTEDGSFCWSTTGLPYSCQRVQTGQIGLVFSDIPPPSLPQTPVLIGGNIRSSPQDELRVGFEDGSSEAIPYVWVTAPINAGFFLYELPKERWVAGRRPTSIALYDPEGNLVSRATFSVTSSIDDHGARAEDSQ